MAAGVGFAGWDRERVKAAARKGGQAASRSGRAHRWTLEEAREAGRKGGQARAEKMRKGGAP